MIQIGDKFEYLKVIEETNERKNRNRVKDIKGVSIAILSTVGTIGIYACGVSRLRGR